MAARTYFGIGSTGDIVKQIQKALTGAGFNTQGVDGWFGKNTADALDDFQQSRQLPVTGSVDERSWQQLLQRPVPSVFERSLQVTAAFEGHGFELAIGNFDDALLTWGIIGFTLASGEIPRIVNAIKLNHPELVRQAFQDSTEELLGLMSDSPEQQTIWADEHTLADGSLVQPWRQMFAVFGSFPEVQEEQMKHVASDYLEPAILTARKLRLSTELGLALCFDISVQNGGIKRAAMTEIQQGTVPAMSEPALLGLIANAVADNARAKFQEDVRRRKLTIARGQGSVHGHNYVLENWGLSGSFLAPELQSTANAAD
jgi:Putative peptidoglycan binding domain/Glycosyl hydrolase family 46